RMVRMASCLRSRTRSSRCWRRTRRRRGPSRTSPSSRRHEGARPEISMTRAGTLVTAQLLAAAVFSAERHRDQRRKGVRETPYINHPLEVAERIVRVAGVDDIEVLVAAILHDTIEDTETTAEEIERHFGKAVAALVLEVTDDRSLTWMERKRLEIEHSSLLSARAKLIKLSDKISNVIDTE